MISSDVFPKVRAYSESKLPLTTQSFVVGNRTNSFRNNFANTYHESQKSSNVYELANTIYSKSPNGKKTTNDILKKRQKPQTPNPETKQIDFMKSDSIQTKGVRGLVRSLTPQSSTLISNLNKRTIMISEYRKSIDDLNMLKQKATKKIQNLKRKIAHQKKLKYKLIIQSQKHMNSSQRGTDYKQKLKRQGSKNKQSQDNEQELCHNLAYHIDIIDKKNIELVSSINQQKRMIQNLQEEISLLIHKVFRQNQELVTLKSNLTIGLKSMKNSSDMIKYLESQKADLLLFINAQIEQNKII